MSGTTEGGKKSAQAGRGDSYKANPVAIENYLEGMKYPAKKNELMNKAKENQAPSDVLSVLNNFDDHQYESVIDVSKEASKLL
jgi:mannitol-specific phosphotransferase system IIBC component